MIDALMTFDHRAVRGGYYVVAQTQTVRTAMRFAEHKPSYQSMDALYKGRHPHNIITEEIYDND